MFLPLFLDIWVHIASKCPNYPKTGKALDLKETNLDVKYEYKDSLLMPMILGLLNISLNCPNAVNTLKEVWILTEMTSEQLRPWLFQIINIGMLTFLFAFTKWQICWTPMKIRRFQKNESHAILLHFAIWKKINANWNLLIH